MLAAIVLLSSCQKDPVSDQTGTTPAKVKSYSEEIISDYLGNSIKNYDVSYDASGRVISIILAPSGDTKITFLYPSANEYTVDIYHKIGTTIHENYYLNSNSFVDSTFQYNETQDSTTEKVVYNSDNQIIKVYEYRYSKITGSVLKQTAIFTYNTDGDLISYARDKDVTTYEYYTDLSYATPVIIGAPNANSTKKKHLIKKNTYTSNGYVAGASDFTYTFDGKNRISTEKQLFSNGAIFIKTYIYF